MANALEVVHVDFSRVWRGGQQQLLLLAGELRTLGCRQWIVARPGVVMEGLQASGVAVLAPEAEARQRARGAAIVHAHDGRAQTWQLRATWDHKARRVLSRRVAYPIRGRMSRWKYARLDLAIAVSGFVAAQVRAAGVAAARVTVIPDAVALEELPDAAAARARVRAALELESAAPCLVCVGALTEEKGIADAVATLAQLPAGWHLLLPGEGPLLAVLRRQAQALGCAARVHFRAGTWTVPEWIAAGDVLLMPSRQEGFGSAALVAMALRRPVVAARTGGIPELVEDETTGLLALPGDIAALAQQCLRVHGDAGLVRRLTEAAGNRVRQHTAARVAAATFAAYQKLLD